MVLCGAQAAEAPEHLPELGISMVREAGFTLDAKTGIAHLLGHGGAMLEDGTFDPGIEGAPLDITFTQARDPDVGACLSLVKKDVPKGQRFVIWGHGTSNSSERRDVFDPVIITFSSITACSAVAMPSPNTAGVGAAAKTAPGNPGTGPELSGAPLSESDAVYLKEALKHDGPAEEIQTARSLSPAFAQRVHEIISDKKLSDAKKKAALRELAQPGLSAGDYRYLAASGHGGMNLHIMSGADQAQLRFLIRDKSVPERGRRKFVDSYLANVEAGLGQKQEIFDEQERVTSSVVVPAALCAMLGFIVFLMQRSATASRQTPPLRRLISWIVFAPGLALLAYTLVIFAGGPLSREQYMLVLPIPVFLALGFFLRIPHHRKRHWVSLYALGGAVTGIALAVFGAATKAGQQAGEAGGAILFASGAAAFISMVVPPYLEQGKGDVIFRVLCFVATLIFAALLLLAAALQAGSKI